MQDKFLFEYAIIRVVPRVEREEFINVGVILYSVRRTFLDAIISFDEDRLLALFEGADVSLVNQHLEAFQLICRGDKRGGPIAILDMPSRFRWLTAKRSTIIQTSPVHPGFCNSPEAFIQKILSTTVL